MVGGVISKTKNPITLSALVPNYLTGMSAIARRTFATVGWDCLLFE
jgi:hypothetical protein